MKSLVQALPLVLVGAVAGHASCADSSATGDTTTNVTVNNPPVDACNEGSPDGHCNALGGDPESCECFDCVETAYCLGGCDDDDVCGAGEDCTCIDCFEPGSQCVGENPTTSEGAGPEGGFGGMGGDMGGAGGAAATASATTSAGGGGAGGGGAGGN